MVRKIVKTKGSQSAPAVMKSQASKSKRGAKLTNGFRGKTDEQGKKESETETSENITAESSEEITETIAKVNTEPMPAEVVKIAASNENIAETENIPQTETAATIPQKRKAAASAKSRESTARTYSKRQKVVLEIPKLSTVNGRVFVIGENACGQLGLGEEVEQRKRPALLDLPHEIVDIAAGGMHSVCLTETGEVYTFGCNDDGALGRSTTEEGSEHNPQRVDIPELIVQISAGDSHSAALSESGQVYIWGNFRNNSGCMGLVTEDAQQTPIKILDTVKIVKIASGCHHLTCLSDAGTVYTCGCGEQGQLGRVSEKSSTDGGRRGIASLLTPDRVPCTKSGRPCVVNNIWTGHFSTFFSIEENGQVYAFGLNNESQLGIQTPHLSIFHPKLVPSFRNQKWAKINGGLHHTLAVNNEGSVYSFGCSHYGRLGLGKNCSNASEPTAIPSLSEIKCTDISCGGVTSFSVSDNGSAYSWGFGENHQLGHGNDEDQHAPKLIEGNFLNSWKALKIAGGGQHTLILAQPRNSSGESQ